MKHKLDSRLLGEIATTSSYAEDGEREKYFLMGESEEELKSLLMRGKQS